MAGQTREQQGCLIKNSKSKVLMVVGVNYEDFTNSSLQTLPAFFI